MTATTNGYLLSFTRRMTPGATDAFCDPLCVMKDGEQLDIFNGRTLPNSRRPSDGAYWDRCYSVLALGVYDADLRYRPDGKLWFLINGGKEVPTALPNINHDWRHVATEVGVHGGYAEDDPNTPEDESWSGSRCCPTVQPSHWARMLDKYFSDGQGGYRIGERVKIEIRGL